MRETGRVGRVYSQLEQERLRLQKALEENREWKTKDKDQQKLIDELEAQLLAAGGPGETADPSHVATAGSEAGATE